MSVLCIPKNNYPLLIFVNGNVVILQHNNNLLKQNNYGLQNF